MRSQLLTGSDNNRVGLSKSFEVNPGDVFDLEVYAKYEAPTGTPSDVNALFNALVNAFSLGAATSPLDGAPAYSAFKDVFAGGGPWINSSMWDEAPPKAYLNYLLFDENFVLVDGGFDQVSTDCEQESDLDPVAPHDYLSLHVKVEQKGYLYVYLSNEQAVLTNVYFDDMKIVQYSSVEQVSDYYPFGLTYNCYARENSVSQEYLYNGKEKQHELALGWLDYGLRMYQPDLGRWNGIDPLAEDYLEISPFAYVANNPALFIDPNGAQIWLAVTYTNDQGEEETSQYRYNNGKLYDSKGDEYDGSDAADPIFQLMKDQLNATKEEFGENEDLSAMFSYLEGDDSGKHTINFFQGENGTEYLEDKESKIKFDPLNWEEPDDFDKKEKRERDPRIGLVHELKHAYDHAKGVYKGKTDWRYEDTVR